MASPYQAMMAKALMGGQGGGGMAEPAAQPGAMPQVSPFGGRTLQTAVQKEDAAPGSMPQISPFGGRRSNAPKSADTRMAMFGGEGAANIDLDRLGTAKQMHSSGSSREEIWDKTGFWQDGGKWNFEFSPDGTPKVVRPSDGELAKGVPFSGIMDFPELRGAYPSASSVTVRSVPRSKMAGADTEAQVVGDGKSQSVQLPTDYLVGRNFPSRQVQLHEGQHAIDNIEGFGREDGRLPWPQRRMERRAENAAQRDLLMTPEERRKYPPWSTEGIAMENWRNSFSAAGQSEIPLSIFKEFESHQMLLNERHSRAVEAFNNHVDSGSASSRGRASELRKRMQDADDEASNPMFSKSLPTRLRDAYGVRFPSK